MMLSIVIPVYNEEATIKKLIDAVRSVDLAPVKKEIVIVNDCSTDRTAEILKTIKHKDIKIITHLKNGGKGAAYWTGVQHATGDIITGQDADLEYDPQDLKKLLEPFIQGRTNVVFGSRFKSSKLSLFDKNTPMKHHLFGNMALSLATTLLYGAKVTDMETGYKLIRAPLIKNLRLKARRFDMEPEITAKLLKRGEKIIEIPISYDPRTHAEGKKISWRDGLWAAWILLKFRLVD